MCVKINVINCILPICGHFMACYFISQTLISNFIAKILCCFHGLRSISKPYLSNGKISITSVQICLLRTVEIHDFSGALLACILACPSIIYALCCLRRTLLVTAGRIRNPPAAKEMMQPLWVTLSSTEWDVKSLRIILTFAKKNKKQENPRRSRVFSMSCCYHLSTCTAETYLSETPPFKFWWHGERVSASEILSNMLKNKTSKRSDTANVNHSVWNYWQLRVVGCRSPFSLCTPAIKSQLSSCNNAPGNSACAARRWKCYSQNICHRVGY